MSLGYIETDRPGEMMHISIRNEVRILRGALDAPEVGPIGTVEKYRSGSWAATATDGQHPPVTFKTRKEAALWLLLHHRVMEELKR